MTKIIPEVHLLKKASEKMVLRSIYVLSCFKKVETGGFLHAALFANK